MESIKGKRGERSTPREAAAQRRLEEMAALLEELAPEPEEIRLSSPFDAQTWEPARDRFGIPMALGMHDGETIQPLVQSQADWDRATIEREELFVRRFGFDWPHRYRVALIRLKHERDLTDREIKLLFRTGSFKRDAGIVHFEGSRSMATAGGVQIAVIFLIFSLLILGVLAPQPLTLRQVAVSGGIAAFLAALEWTLYRIYITPWRIYVRTQANTSAAPIY